MPRLPHLSLALLLPTSVAFADLVTGRVVDANGVGVPGININAFYASDGNEEDNVFNDGTDANGNFSTTIPPGVYDLHFLPPPPPGTTHVPLVVRNVAIAGTRALGTLTLEAGVSLSGRCQTQAGIPVANVDVEVLEAATGLVVPQAQQATNAFGNFAVAVPTRAIELRLITTGIAAPVLASRALDLVPSANTNLGNLTLQDGFRVTGHVQRATNGAAVASVDLDFVSRATGEKLYTPNDSTNSLGNVTVTVPAGDYDVEFCAPFAARLAGKSVLASVPSSLDLGVIALDPGFVLSGTIRSAGGTPQVNADVDVRLIGVGKVVTCGDNSNASGAYAFVVPGGTLRVVFHPPSYDVGLGSKVENNVIVTADTVLDGVLPVCAGTTSYGTGLAGTGGIVPSLTTSGGVPTIDNSNFALELQNGRGGANAFLLIGFGPAAVPVLGGTLLVQPANGVRLLLPLGGTPGAAGAGSRRLSAQPMPGLVGLEMFAQFFVQDPAAAQGWAFSNAIRFRVCR